MNTVLVVDDNPVSRELIREVLQSEQWQIIEAANGREAVDRSRHNRPDVILLDIQMPDMDGFAVLRELLQDSHSPRPRVAAITAYAMQGDREKALAAGFDDYITKPIRPASFRASVQKLLHKGI